MTHVEVREHFEQSPGEVWAVLGDFTVLEGWFPGIEGCASEADGKRRRISLPGGATVIEELVSRDEAAMTLSYRIVEAPMPFTDYESRINVVGVPDGTSVAWEGDFTPTGSEGDAAKLLGGIYRKALDALKDHLGK